MSIYGKNIQTTSSPIFWADSANILHEAYGAPPYRVQQKFS